MRVVNRLAQSPRPVGSRAHAESANFLLQELEDLGFQTEVQETPWRVEYGSGGQVVVSVRNLLARFEGTQGERALLLMAHYDSQPNTFGAGDDASGVAVILESVRALLGDGPLQQDLIVAITDAEEIGLVGAEAFAGSHPWFREADLVLNFEARGQRGLSMMFETADGELGLMRAFAEVAPYPAANSLAFEVYKRMPNDTDFSVVKRNGGRGLNFAFIGGHTAYHTTLDRADLLDRGTLQQEGANALALIRRFDAEGLASPGEDNGVYFNPIGAERLIVVSERSAQFVAVLALLASLGLCLFGRLRRDLGWVALPKILGRVGLGCVLGGLATYSLWSLVERFSGGEFVTPHGVPYSEGLVLTALSLAALASSLLVSGSTPRRIERLLGLSLLWSCIAVVLAFFVTGATYLGAVPAVCLVLTAWVHLATTNEIWRGLSFGLALCLVCMLWMPVLGLVLAALTVHASGVFGVVACLASSCLLPLFGEFPRRRTVILCACLLSVALVTYGTWGVGTPTRPAVGSLWYELDPESGANWRSSDRPGSASLADLGLSTVEQRSLPAALDRRQREAFSAPADVIELDAPSVELVSDLRRRDGRRLELRIRSRRGAPILRVAASSQVSITDCEIDGAGCSVGPSGNVRFSYYGVGETGVLLTLETESLWPLEVEVFDQSWGLPSIAPDRKAGQIPATGWWTDSVMVGARELL